MFTICRIIVVVAIGVASVAGLVTNNFKDSKNMGKTADAIADSVAPFVLIVMGVFLVIFTLVVCRAFIKCHWAFDAKNGTDDPPPRYSDVVRSTNPPVCTISTVESGRILGAQVSATANIVLSSSVQPLHHDNEAPPNYEEAMRQLQRQSTSRGNKT